MACKIQSHCEESREVKTEGRVLKMVVVYCESNFFHTFLNGVAFELLLMTSLQTLSHKGPEDLLKFLNLGFCF